MVQGARGREVDVNELSPSKDRPLDWFSLVQSGATFQPEFQPFEAVG